LVAIDATLTEDAQLGQQPRSEQARAAAVDETAPPSGLTHNQYARAVLLLSITAFCFQVTMNVTESIKPNFFRDVLGMDGSLNGYLVAIREVPGFLLIFVAAALLRLGMARATSVSLVIAGVGFALFATSHSFGQIIIPTLVSSIGYHSVMQLQPALGLTLAKPGEEGAVLGRFSSIGFFGSMLAMTTVFFVLLGVEHWQGDLREHQEPFLRLFFIVAGLSSLIGALAIFRFPISSDDRAIARAAPRITWRREYRLYYWLSFLDGSRMQIYFAFASFVLVEQFDVNARALTLLLIVAALINWLTGKPIGRAVDRFGEKKILTVGYCCHLLVFLGFAFAPNAWVAYLCYLGYNWLFLFSMGTTTYLRKICRREDLAPSLAMGVSLSHLTAIVVPIFGAALWNRLGYQFPFLFGTVFILLSLYSTQKIDVAKQRFSVAEA
jgi:MFS family permease